MNASREPHPAGEGRLRELFASAPLSANKWDSYFDVYERTFARFVGRGITFVEVGVDAGGSLLMWKAYFQNARIIGVDINPDARELARHGVEIFIGDQASEAFWDEFYKAVGPIDVLLDDGGHHNREQIVTVDRALPQVRDHGVVLVEDVHTSYMRQFLNPARHSFINFAKHLVDSVNAGAPGVGGTDRHRDVVSAVEFHQSIVVIHVDRVRAATPTEVENQGLARGGRESGPPPARRARFRFVRSIPLLGPLGARCLMLWDRWRIHQQLARYFRD